MSEYVLVPLICKLFFYGTCIVLLIMANYYINS
jgi:hypothetical protein